MKVRNGRGEQWRSFELARDIPPELHQWVHDFTREIEHHPQIRRDFDTAISAAFKAVNTGAIIEINRFEAALRVLLDIWEYGPQLRKWLNDQANNALDSAFPLPVPRSLRPKSFW